MMEYGAVVGIAVYAALAWDACNEWRRGQFVLRVARMRRLLRAVEVTAQNMADAFGLARWPLLEGQREILALHRADATPEDRRALRKAEAEVGERGRNETT